VTALTTVDVESVLGRALSDISYRAAGLEGVAAILEYQSRGRVELQMGAVTAAGFEQALPASMRPAFENLKQVKIAPSYLGIFQPGDWVTTFLAELVLDYGVIWLFFPAAVAGLLVGCLDAIWLRIGQLSVLSGLIVLRIPFLLYPLTIGSNFAAMTVLFFKATVGYWILLLMIGISMRIRFIRHITGR